jgi:hypothetical protein
VNFDGAGKCTYTILNRSRRPGLTTCATASGRNSLAGRAAGRRLELWKSVWLRQRTGHVPEACPDPAAPQVAECKLLDALSRLRNSNASRLQSPAPRAAMYRKMKQNKTAGMP